MVCDKMYGDIVETLYVISGVTGMTGNELARQILVDDTNTVIGFDNFFASSIDTISDLLENPRLFFYEYDINNATHMEDISSLVLSMKSKFRKVVFVNCAAVVHTEYFYDVAATFETNVIGMKTFLEQSIEVGADIFINCSTSEVYSMQSWNEGGVKESDFLVMSNAEHSQRTSYATGKLLTEFFMKDAVISGKIRGCSLRFANVYSKNERFSKHIIPHILHSLIRDNKVVLLENAKVTKRTFLHNYDSCSAILSLIASNHALDGSVYNVATNEEISIVDLVHLCAKKLMISDPEIVYSGYRESDPERRLLSIEKLQSRTTWIPQVNLDTGIDMCIEYLKNDLKSEVPQ